MFYVSAEDATKRCFREHEKNARRSSELYLNQFIDYHPTTKVEAICLGGNAQTAVHISMYLLWQR